MLFSVVFYYKKTTNTRTIRCKINYKITINCVIAINYKPIIKTDIIAVNAKEDDEDVANIMNKYNLVVIPVIDNDNKLIGRITVDDILDVDKEEAEKDYQMASGISEDIEINNNIWKKCFLSKRSFLKNVLKILPRQVRVKSGSE